MQDSKCKAYDEEPMKLTSGDELGSNCIDESDIDRSVFDEYEDTYSDETTMLRQIVDFKLHDSETGKLMSFDELGEGRKKGVLTGVLIEHHTKAFRDYMISLLVTVPQSTGLEQEEFSNNPSIPAYLTDSDSDNDIMDRYCLSRSNT